MLFTEQAMQQSLGLAHRGYVLESGRLRVIATVQDPAVVRTILAHLGRTLSTEAPGPAPPAPAAIG